MDNSFEMWLSTRSSFQRGDAGWDEYLQFVGLPHLHEVRSIDPYCNPCAQGHQPIYSIEELWDRIALLTEPLIGHEYHQIFLDVRYLDPSFSHLRLRLLGYDLSDDTWTSSLLNCGRWGGALEPIAARTATNGLLTLDDALLAQTLLPNAWDDDPHSFVTVWAVFEILPEVVPRADG